MSLIRFRFNYFVSLLVLGLVFYHPRTQTDFGKLSFENRVLAEINAENIRGINPDYLLTISVLETGHGRGVDYVQTHNLFSIKAENGYSGEMYCNTSCYRRYRNDAESIKDVVRLLSTRARYRQAYKFALMDERLKFFKALQDNGYSENKQYAESLERIFETLKRTEVSRRFNQFPLVVNNINYGATIKS